MSKITKRLAVFEFIKDEKHKCLDHIQIVVPAREVEDMVRVSEWVDVEFTMLEPENEH